MIDSTNKRKEMMFMLREVQICIMQAIVLLVLPLMIIAGIWNLLF